MIECPCLQLFSLLFSSYSSSKRRWLKMWISSSYNNETIKEAIIKYETINWNNGWVNYSVKCKEHYSHNTGNLHRYKYSFFKQAWNSIEPSEGNITKPVNLKTFEHFWTFFPLIFAFFCNQTGPFWYPCWWCSIRWIMAYSLRYPYN